MGVLRDLMGASKRPEEFVALIRYRRQAAAVERALRALRGSDWGFCYEMLARVSRSFAVVILELDKQLRDPVCLFYLVLRGMDTIEDDTSKPPAVRIALCRSFHTRLDDPAWRTADYGAGHERALLADFHRVNACYRQLKPHYRQVIQDITRRMGEGMASHIRQVSCESVDDYDTYCHYVAGLVGCGLSRMFAASGREEPAFAHRDKLSNSMGVFLQKVNVIRDYLEDIEDGRTFWPKEIWSQYGDTLEELKEVENRKFALAALNHMVTDALRHVPDCIEYMRLVRDPRVFKFVAIPQVMAIGTLAECYNNPAVFEGVVKLRRGLTAKLVMRTRSMATVCQLFFDFAHAIFKKVEDSDPSAQRTRAILNNVIDLTFPHVAATPDLRIPNALSLVAFAVLTTYVLRRRQEHDDGAVFTWRSAGGIMELRDMLAVGLLFLVCMYFFSFFGLHYFSQVRLHRRRAPQDDECLQQFGPPPAGFAHHPQAPVLLQ